MQSTGHILPRCAKPFLSFGVLLISLFTFARAALAQYQFDSWTTENGLPQNAVNAIVQTRDGYLWLATFDGLVRFDGVQFTVFNKGNTKGIGSNRFDLLFEDRHGALWAGTEDNRVIRYQAGVFTTYSPDDGWPSSTVTQIEEDEAGNFQVVSRKEIAKWKDGRFTSYALEDLLPESAGAKWVGGNRLAWVGANGLSWYSRGRLNTYSVKSGLPEIDFASVHVFEDQHGTAWIRTTGGGVVRVKDGHFVVLPVKDNRLKDIPAREDRNGNIWLGGADVWLGRLKDGRLTRYTLPSGFRESRVMCFYEDREGNFWIGSSGGLYCAREAAITMYTRREGLSSDNVYPIYEDQAGALWFGTWGYGVTKYQDGRFTRYAIQDSYGRDFITTLYEDRDGYMWIGTGIGLHRLKDGRLRAYPDPDGFFSEGTWAIHQDRAGRFWFGTSKGLIKLEGGRYTRFTTADGLAGDDVKAILEDRAGHLWFGTWGGLTHFSEGRFTSYTEQGGLASDHIRSLYEDADGLLWIGTYDGGLGRFREGRFTRYTTKEGLFNNGVFQILEDERGHFWMSCNKGIYRVARQELNDFAEGRARSITSIAYGKTDGLLNIECNGGRQPSGLKTADGRLWFPTMGGVAVIDPKAIQINTEPPPVIIEEFHLGNEAIDFLSGVEIGPDINNFEIRYTAPSFIKPEQVKFKYKLVGLDEDWIDAGDRRTANYYRIPAGRYRFVVIAANSDGVWNTEGKSIEIVIVPPFWRRWWFIASAIVASLSIVLLIYERRVWRLRREHTLQQAFSQQLIGSQESERRRISNEMHDSLGQDLNIIKVRALLSKERLTDNDAVKEELDEITFLAEKIYGEMKEIAYDLRPYQLDKIGLSKTIERMVRRVGRACEIDFVTDIAEIDDFFEKDSQINIYRIVQESVNNIIKHSKATRARVTIKRGAGSVEISIEDNGEGFRLEPIDPTDPAKKSFGLMGISERAKMLGGEVEVRSDHGQGTTVVVRFKLKEARYER